MATFLLLILLLQFFFVNSISSLSSPDRFTRSLPPSLLRRPPQDPPQEYFEVAPLPFDQVTPPCSHTILRHSFANTMNTPPFTTLYSPPSDCSSPWSRVVLEFSAACKGEQYDRIAGLWLGGAEILRTSTAEPTESGIVWKVRKDISRYSSLLVKSDLNVTMMLENIVNDVYTGVYHVNVTLFFYKEVFIRVPSTVSDKRLSRKLGSRGDNLGFKSGKLGENSEIRAEEYLAGVNMGQGDGLVYRSPADLIIPISYNGDNKGHWFRIESESDSHSKEIQIPPNTQKAILELYVSFHGNDEFWYSNPPNSYIETNNLTTRRGNGAFREVYVKIDGKIVGSEVPFPVIFTGGINPLFWEPIVGIGAFDLPTYDFELTPFLGMLLDGNKVHSLTIGVVNGISYWLVDANLHIWLDHQVPFVQAKSTVYHSPAVKMEHIADFKQLDGSFKIEAERKMKFSGWVKSSTGNFTTVFSHEFKFRSLIRFNNNGTYKIVKQRVEAKRRVKVENDRRDMIASARVKRKYPLIVITSTQPGSVEDTYLLVTNVTRGLREKYSNADSRRSIINSQNSGGWMQVKDHSVLSGSASTRQSLSYKDDSTCYVRSVLASGGRIIEDNSTYCA